MAIAQEELEQSAPLQEYYEALTSLISEANHATYGIFAHLREEVASLATTQHTLLSIPLQDLCSPKIRALRSRIEEKAHLFEILVDNWND